MKREEPSNEQPKETTPIVLGEAQQQKTFKKIQTGTPKKKSKEDPSLWFSSSQTEPTLAVQTKRRPPWRPRWTCGRRRGVLWRASAHVTWEEGKA